MSFSTEERRKAHEPQVIYNVGTIGALTGNMGSGRRLQLFGSPSVVSGDNDSDRWQFVQRGKGRRRRDRESLRAPPLSAQRADALPIASVPGLILVVPGDHGANAGEFLSQHLRRLRKQVRRALKEIDDLASRNVPQR